MKISAKAKERFCKDCNIPLKLFQEPYFIDRLKLYDRFYGTFSKWELFVKELEKYHCEQDYFEEYNQVKDTVLTNIKNAEGYQKFNNEDMNKFRIQNTNLPNKDIYKPSNDGKTFISIDMRKANFSALQHYDSTIFASASTWEDYVSLYTDNMHIINSKYIRQVILGNCNPKRHITYEKYLMDGVLTYLIENNVSADQVVFFSNDEIVIDVSNMNETKQMLFHTSIGICTNNMCVPLKVEMFTLHKIEGSDGYCKQAVIPNGTNSMEFKCLDNYILPFVLRKVLGQEITENDKVFYHEGLLAKFIEIPEIEVKLGGYKN